MKLVMKAPSRKLTSLALGLTCAIVLLPSQSQSQITVTDGGLETSWTGWFGDTGEIQTFIAPAGQFVGPSIGTRIMGSSGGSGWIYQSLGNRAAYQNTIEQATIDVLKRNPQRTFGSIVVRVWSGSFAGAAHNNDIAAAGLNLVVSTTITAASVGFDDGNPFLAETATGVDIGVGTDISGIAVGTEFWISVHDTGGAAGAIFNSVNGTEPYWDNIVLVAPEPTSAILVVLGCLPLFLRRRR